MSDVSQRIQRLTSELNALRVHLRWTNSQSACPGDHRQLLDQVVSANLVSNLTDVVDQLTQFLWRYIDSAAAAGEGTDFSLQSKQIEEVTDLLRLLRRSCMPKSAPEPSTFVARVNDIVDRHSERDDETLLLEQQRGLRLERSA
jgi:hypothetical protein